MRVTTADIAGALLMSRMSSAIHEGFFSKHTMRAGTRTPVLLVPLFRIMIHSSCGVRYAGSTIRSRTPGETRDDDRRSR